MSDYNSTVRPTHVVWQGKRFPIVQGHDGLHYILDPDFHLPAPHVPVGLREGVIVPGLPGGYGGGMGAIPAGAVHAAAVAANFIPAVGPFISAGIELVSGLFGGGDPTPIAQLWEQIITLRSQLADMRNAMADAGYGDADDFDAGTINPDDDNTGGVLAAVITNEVLNKFPGETDGEQLRHVIKRGDEYAAIHALQSLVQQTGQQYAQVEQELHDQALIAAARGDQGDGAGGDQGDGSGGTDAAGATVTNWAPWIAGGGGLVLLAFLASR